MSFSAHPVLTALLVKMHSGKNNAPEHDFQTATAPYLVEKKLRFSPVTPPFLGKRRDTLISFDVYSSFSCRNDNIRRCHFDHSALNELLCAQWASQDNETGAAM